MRRWLIVIDDPESELSTPEEAEALFRDLIHAGLWRLKVARVQRGGLLADKVMAELPPVRHERMGRPR